MDNREHQENDTDDLRRRAEAMARILATKGKGYPKDMSPEETWYLVHDLQVHQIELEMQNEELRRAHAELEIMQSRYFELFDVAPVGYVVIDGTGLVTEVNLTTAALLGFQRAEMAAQPFTKYIARQDQDNYYFQRKRLFETERRSPSTCGCSRSTARASGPTWRRLSRGAVTARPCAAPS
ncbi:MAG: PAS domain-containing protein [bacterium]|nr:PAS domain-containing protein [bacterium]